QLVLIVTSTNGVVHDTASPRISLDVRSGHPAPRDGYYTGSHLDGSHTHGRICPVTLRNRGYPVGGFHRLAGGRSILGLGKCVFRDRRQRGADRAVRFADPADDRRRWPAAVGKHCEPGFRDTATLDRGGPGVSHRGWHLPRALGGRTPALALCAACRDWRRHDWLLCRRRSGAAGAKGARRPEGGLWLVPFWHRRPRRGGDHGGNDVPGTSPPLGLRCAEPPDFILSAGDGPDLRRSAGPHAARPRSFAAEAEQRPDRPAGRGVMPFAASAASSVRTDECRTPKFELTVR